MKRINTAQHKVIGITGSFGTGKSTCARLFAQTLNGIHYNADDDAKYLMQHSPQLKKKIKKFFGNTVFDGNSLNTKYLASIVFSNKKKLARLESIVHPEVFKSMEKIIKQYRSKKFVICEVPLLIEAGFNRAMDVIIVVTASRDTIWSRLKSKGFTKKQVIERLSRQMPQTKKTAYDDFIIRNTSTLKELQKKVRKIANQIKE